MALKDFYSKIPRQSRAHIVDWMLHAYKALRQEDKNLVFLAMNIVDRYISETKPMIKHCSVSDF